VNKKWRNCPTDKSVNTLDEYANDTKHYITCIMVIINVPVNLID